MRYQHIKLKKGQSTKSERIFGEILKSLKIKYRTKVKINNREVDFLVNNYAIEINGHDQITQKNKDLLELGYIPIHYTNNNILSNRTKVKEDILKLIK